VLSSGEGRRLRREGGASSALFASPWQAGTPQQLLSDSCGPVLDTAVCAAAVAGCVCAGQLKGQSDGCVPCFQHTPALDATQASRHG
jgi:hypothetical protein